MNARKYSDDFRAEVLAMYEVDGPAATARLYGMSVHTLKSWATRLGLHSGSQTKKATEAACAKNEARRTELRGLLLEYAVKLMKRMDAPHIDFKSAGALGPVQVTFPVAPAAACQNYATSVGILLDKYRLEAGQVTDRVEVLALSEIDAEIARLEAQFVDSPDDGG